jgi:predicted alpha/beta-fold hydrolase
MEAIQEREPVKFDRDLIKLKDGGTAGVDWNIDEDGSGRPKPNEKKPILLLYPGLSGGNKNLYTLSLARQA